jgi:hypothetical protein
VGGTSLAAANSHAGTLHDSAGPSPAATHCVMHGGVWSGGLSGSRVVAAAAVQLAAAPPQQNDNGAGAAEARPLVNEQTGAQGARVPSGGGKGLAAALAKLQSIRLQDAASGIRSNAGCVASMDD